MKTHRGTLLLALLFIFPASLIVFVFRLVPVIYSFIVSFYDWGVAGMKGFIGLDNYVFLMKDPEFWQSLVNTFYYVLYTVPVTLVLSLIIAILLNQKIKGLGIYRVIYFLPVVTSLVAVSMVWKWIFNPEIGLANYMLSLIGIPRQLWLQEAKGVFQLMLSPVGIDLPRWAGGPSLALMSIIIMSVWKGVGYNVVIFLAGLQNIGEQYYEAAKLDGANRFQQFWHVTLPLLSPTTFFVLVMTTITSFQVFVQIYMMTGPPVGGPAGTTKVLVYYLYEKGFETFESGYASAIAFVLFMIILTLTIIQRQVIEPRVHYD
ncbi:MAG: sugar ABC transporter permease [Gemmatimonadetes bacterium]|nr:MAG: sugar ABC transporter permease [Gemmatimonadota bacterium]